MKYLFLHLLALTMGLVGQAQTNTFPSSGNTGIGTTSPAAKLEVVGTAAFGKHYFNVLTVPIDDDPSYIYVNTKIPFTDSPAPQLEITAYNYASSNKAIKLTLGWYVYAGAFYWYQYKSELGYYNPSSIKLGTYDDSGTTRIRIEIANSGVYWSGYFISATDKNGDAANYSGWTYGMGSMPSGTGNIVTVPEMPSIVYSNSGKVGIGTNAPSARLDLNQADSEVPMRINTSSTSNSAYTLYSANGSSGWEVGMGNASTSYKYMFSYGSFGTSNAKLTIQNDGKVGIGTVNPQSELSVNGTIQAKKVKVTQTGWADFVFEPTYALRPLNELEWYVRKNKHLPEIPSAQEVIQHDLDLGSMDQLLLQKIEELTLYIIQLEKLNKQALERLDALESQQKGKKGK